MLQRLSVQMRSLHPGRFCGTKCFSSLRASAHPASLRYPLPRLQQDLSFLCFHILTKPFFRNPFLLIFMQIGGGWG
jgi:hypothetical protein